MICAGIDGGSRAIKIVLIDGDSQEVLATGVCDQGVDHDRLATVLFEELLANCNAARSDVGRVVATGYARNLIKAGHTTITEISSHAVGVRRRVPEAMSIVEIGGQDSKVIWLEAEGGVRDFAMNDRCAAGTGRFLEMVASRMEVPLAEIGHLAQGSKKPATISSTCVVFAETEIIGLLASGALPADIVAGVQAAIASRVAAMTGGRMAEPVVFTGGVARVPGMREALGAALGLAVTIAPEPQTTGALGAAILAANQLAQMRGNGAKRDAR